MQFHMLVPNRPPARVFLVQRQVNDAQMRTGRARHHNRFSVNKTVLWVYMLQTLMSRAGQGQVGMPSNNRINSGHRCQGDSRILKVGRGCSGAKPCMGKCHNQIASPGSQFPRFSMGARQDVLYRNGTFQAVRFPLGRLRWEDREHTDFQNQILPLHFDVPVKNRMRLPACRAVGSGGIAANDRARGLGDYAVQYLKPEPKVMVSQSNGVITKVIKGLHQDVTAVGLRHGPFTNGRTLKGVTIVEQQDKAPLRLGLRSGRFDQTCGSAQADRRVSSVRIIVESGQIHVQIGCRQYPDLRCH